MPYLASGQDIKMIAPDFILPDVLTDRNWSLYQVAEGKPFVVMFIGNHCPYVKHIESEISKIAKIYFGEVAFAAVSSNNVAFYPDESPEHLKSQGERLGFNFPYFYDDRQQIAREFKVVYNPDFFVFDKDKKLVYHGQFDDSRPNNSIEVTGRDLVNAIENATHEEKIIGEQKQAYGCKIFTE